MESKLMPKKINVNLYGGKSLFGGKESPLEADEIYCERSEQCSFYKNERCLRCRAFLQPHCKFGRNNVHTGYTSRAAKYHDFKRRYTSDDCYNKLSYPSELAGVVDGYLYLNLKYTLVRKKKEENEAWRKVVNGYVIESAGLCDGSVWIPVEEATNELLCAVLSYHPTAMMGGEISDYQSKVVPDIMMSLKKYAKEIYDRLISEYPKFDIAPNYVGKYAFIKTMVEGSELTDCHGNKFVIKEGKLVGEKIKRGFVPFNGIMDCVVEVDENATYKINSNDQCDENTKFR